MGCQHCVSARGTGAWSSKTLGNCPKTRQWLDNAGDCPAPAKIWKSENPEGEHLKVAKAEAPPQTPPAWPRLVHQDRTG